MPIAVPVAHPVSYTPAVRTTPLPLVGVLVACSGTSGKDTGTTDAPMTFPATTPPMDYTTAPVMPPMPYTETGDTADTGSASGLAAPRPGLSPLPGAAPVR